MVKDEPKLATPAWRLADWYQRDECGDYPPPPRMSRTRTEARLEHLAEGLALFSALFAVFGPLAVWRLWRLELSAMAGIFVLAVSIGLPSWTYIRRLERRDRTEHEAWLAIHAPSETDDR